jgi:hypothetical protein
MLSVFPSSLHLTYSCGKDIFAEHSLACKNFFVKEFTVIGWKILSNQQDREHPPPLLCVHRPSTRALIALPEQPAMSQSSMSALEFEKLCLRLQSNDRTLTRVSTDIVMGARIDRLVAALQANTHVSSLKLRGWRCSLDSDLQGAYNLQSAALRPFRALLSFLRHSQSLQSVQLRSFCAHGLRDLVVAICANPIIVTMDLGSTDDTDTLSFAIGNPAPSWTSLKRLGMPVSAEAVELAEEFFLSLETLEYLELKFDDFGSAWRRFMAIARVADHPTVTDLKLELPFDTNNDAIIHNLSSLLVSTNLLSSLTINFYFDESIATAFVDALRQNQSLTALTFDSCYFDDTDETIPIFVDFFQNVNVKSPSSIRALSFASVNLVSENCFTGRQLSELVAGPGGGGIESLDLVEFHYCWMSGLWSGLEANAQSRTLRSIKLPQLIWDSVYLAAVQSDFDAMLRHLPAMLYLRTVSFDGPLPNMQAFLGAIRVNGSLHDVAFTARALSFTVISTTVKGFLDACGERNALLPDLLQFDEQSMAPVALFPTLCAASQQTPRMAPNLLLAGLLAFDRN